MPGYAPDMLVSRPGVIARIHRSFRVHPVVALNGPRQCGKTTNRREGVSDPPGTTVAPPRASGTAMGVQTSVVFHFPRRNHNMLTTADSE